MINDVPTISVIVPVYKVEKYLMRCVSSILNQTYKNYELILVDDGSPDSCGSICDELEKKDDRIRVIHKVNGGLSSARNAGIEIARGEFIYFIDSDDWISEDMLEHMMNLARQHNAEIVSVSYCLATSDTKPVKSDYKVSVYNREQALEYYMSVGMKKRVADYPVWIKLYKRNLFDTFRFPNGQLYEDVATNYELIKNVNVYVKSSKICYYYFQEGTSIVRSKFKMRDMDAVLIGEQLVDLARDDNAKLQLLAKQKLDRAYFSLLTKITVYGIDESVKEPQKVIRDLLCNLRRCYWNLLRSDMPLNRKVFMTLLVIDYRIPQFMIHMIRRG